MPAQLATMWSVGAATGAGVGANVGMLANNLVGGALGGVALALIYALVPRVGLDAVVVLALVGHLLTSLLAGHLGWLDLPRARLTPRKLLGALLLQLQLQRCDARCPGAGEQQMIQLRRERDGDGCIDS